MGDNNARMIGRYETIEIQEEEFNPFFCELLDPFLLTIVLKCLYSL